MKSNKNVNTTGTSLFAQFAVVSIQQIFGGPAWNGFTAARSLPWNIRIRCILLSQHFHFFIYGSLDIQAPTDATGNSL